MRLRLSALAFALSGLLAGAMPAQAADQGWTDQLQPFAQARLEAWSNGLPVLDFSGEWGGSGYQRRDGEQRAYLSARAELGLSWLPGGQAGQGRHAAAWSLAWLTRVDGTARASGQAAQVLHHVQSRTDPDQPVSYNADTDTQFWRGQGLSLRMPLRLATQDQPWAVEARWDHMKLRRLRNVRTRGQVNYNADESYGFHGTLRDDDVKATTPFMAHAAPSGSGDALSLKLAWQRSAGEPDDSLLPRHLSLHWEDAWSRLAWNGVNGNDAVLDSDVSQRTPEGYIEYQAAIHGQYTRRRMVQRIAPAVQLDASWAAPKGEWTLRLRQRLGLRQHWFGWQGPGEHRWRLALEPVARAWQIGGDAGAFSATLMGNRLDGEGHQLGAVLGWGAPF